MDTAASYLRTAASYLRTTAGAANTTAARDTATEAARMADMHANTAATAATTARMVAATATNGLSDEEGALGTAADALGTAAGNLGTAATALTNAATQGHVRFTIRAEVNPGDEAYVLVVAADAAPTLAVRFHGAIAASDVLRQDSLNAGDQHPYPITVTAPGLLTVETTGSTDTAGMLSGIEAAMDDSSGSGNNFRIVVPVSATSYTVSVDGQTPSTEGAYTLDMDFKVARQGVTGTGVMVPNAPDWGNATSGTPFPDDDTTLQIKRIAEDGSRADADYFLFTIDNDNSGFLTVETKDDTTSARDSDTTGTLYGPTGEITRDTSSGAGRTHFKIRTPAEEGMAYLVKVEGTDGVYQLDITLTPAEGDDIIAVPGTESGPATEDCTAGTTNADDTNNGPNEICRPESGESLEIERFAFNIMESGALYLHTTGSIDTVGVLYGPDGRKIAEDDNSGQGNNFRIAANVDPGLHLVEIRGQDRMTEGTYSLVSNFVTGEEVTTTTPGTGTEVAALQAEIDRLEDELAACEAPVETDSRGAFENPADGGVRSGIGVISGWVCAAEEVEIVIYRGGRQVRELSAAYGTSRPDTVGHCGHRSPNTGFGMTYNFNHLPEGEYTIKAFVGDDELRVNDQGDTEATFEVVHLVDTFPDTHRFLVDLPDGECRAPDFPARGETTLLKWEQSTQNFVVHNVLDQ